MARKTVQLSPEAELVIEKMGIRIQKARLRRNILAEVLAEHAGISKGTLTAHYGRQKQHFILGNFASLTAQSCR